MDQGYSGSQAAEVVGITYRQLDYWARTDLIRPSSCDAKGSGTRRVYNYRNLLELGIKLESVREVFRYLRDHVDTEITAAHIVISGQSVVLCQGDQLVDVMRGGQGVLNVLPLAGVKEQVDSRIVLMSNAALQPQIGQQKRSIAL